MSLGRSVAMASPLKSPYSQPAKDQRDLWSFGLKPLSEQDKAKRAKEERKAAEALRQATVSTWVGTRLAVGRTEEN